VVLGVNGFLLILLASYFFLTKSRVTTL